MSEKKTDMPAAGQEPLLRVSHLRVSFQTDKALLCAVEDVSFDVRKGETLWIVWESGFGKSISCMSILKLVQGENVRYENGTVLFEGEDTLSMTDKQLQKIRGLKISMIFQEPMTSLNPVFRIGDQVDEVIKLHHPEMSKEDIKARTLEMLELVGIANKEGVYRMYPHELSGGMRQRVMIAIALACNPGLIIADEPTTALDVTIQAQILDLLVEHKEKINSSIMLITHDLGVVAGMADYVVVMYAGRVVEKGTADDIFHHPAHPYTIGLMRSKPVVGKKVDELYNITGAVPNPVDMPNYCYFRDRCYMRCDQCEGKYPPEIRISDTHVVSCYRFFDTGEVLGYPKSVNVEEL